MGRAMSRKVSFFINGLYVYHSLKPYDPKSHRCITNSCIGNDGQPESRLITGIPT